MDIYLKTDRFYRAARHPDPLAAVADELAYQPSYPLLSLQGLLLAVASATHPADDDAMAGHLTDLIGTVKKWREALDLQTEAE